MLVTDVERLLTYSKQHLRELTLDDNHVSRQFLDIDMHFLIQAYQGEVLSADRGAFALRFMVNMGRAEVGESYSYLGSMSVITVPQTNAFTRAGRAVPEKYNSRLETDN